MATVEGEQAHRHGSGRAGVDVLGRVLRAGPAGERREEERGRAGRKAPHAGGDPRDGPVGVARSEGAAEAHRRVRRHCVGRDDDACARQGASRDHDGRGRRAPTREPWRRAALHDRPDLRQRRRARGHDGDPHRQDRPEAVRHQLQSPGQGLSDDRRAGAGDARRVHQVLHPRSQEAPGGVQAGHHARPAAVPRHARRWHRPQRPVPAQGRLDGSHGAGVDAPTVEERLEHGHQRAAGRCHGLHPDLPQGRARVDGGTRTADRATAR